MQDVCSMIICVTERSDNTHQVIVRTTEKGTDTKSYLNFAMIVQSFGEKLWAEACNTGNREYANIEFVLEGYRSARKNPALPDK